MQRVGWKRILLGLALACPLVVVSDSFVAPAVLADLYGTSVAEDGRYIVVVEPGTDIDSFAAGAARAGARVLRRYRFAVRGIAAELSASEVTAMRANPEVRYLEKSRKLKVTEAPWGIDRIDQRELPLDGRVERGIDGRGVTAYVIDTGIMASHVEFGDRVTNGYSVFGSFTDCNGHGTHVAGTIGGETVGVANAVEFVTVRVLDCSGSGTVEGVINGINWMIANHRAGVPAVANMSLGAGYSKTLNDAVASAVDDGIVMAVAAGNSNADACDTSPASAPDAITVGAVTRYDDRASYSNFGTCLDLFGPGSDIKSASIEGRDEYQSLSGTSMASPHVAGVAALYLGEHPDADPSEVTEALVQGSTRNVVHNPGVGSPNVLISTLAITDPDAPSPSTPPPTLPPTTTTSPWRPVTTTTQVPLIAPEIDLSIRGRDVVVEVNSGSRYWSSYRMELMRGYSNVASKWANSFTYVDEGRATTYGTLGYTVRVTDSRGNKVTATASIRVDPPSPPRVDERNIVIYKDGYRYIATIPFSSYYSGDYVSLYCGYGDGDLVTTVSARSKAITVTLTSSLYSCQLWGMSDTGAADDYNTFDLRRY